MNKLYITIIIFSLSVAQDSGGSLAFMNISPTANARSLGNTIGSEINNPASLLFSPANIWQYSSTKLSLSHMSLATVEDLSYNNIFLSKKFKDWTLAAGGINLGIKRIEEYDEQAVFGGYFNYQSTAMMLGISNKVSNFVWGMGVNMITEGFSNNLSDKNNHIGFNLGVTFLDIKLSNIYLSTGMSSRSILVGTDKTNSAYSTSSVFMKLTRVFEVDNFKLTVNGFSDIQIQQYLNRYFINLGLQGSATIYNQKVFLNAGLSNIPMQSEGDDLIAYALDNKKFSLGCGAELLSPSNSKKWKVNIQLAQVFDSYYQSTYVTIGFTKRK